MSFERKIAHLEETHAMLERELSKALIENVDQLHITELKKKKLHVKDLILDLQRLDSQGKKFP